MDRVPEKILQEKIVQGKHFYQVQWQNQDGIANLTWEPKSSLGEDFKQLKKEFLQNQHSDEDDCEQSNLQEDTQKRYKKESKNILNFNKESQIPVSIDDMYGDLESGDKPKNILKIRKLNNEIEFIVEWEQRHDKFQPKESVVTNTELKKYYPDILMKFYENNIVFQIAN